MAENPATWGEAEKVIDAAYENWHTAHMQEICGYSLARFIADALREAGLLQSWRAACPCGWQTGTCSSPEEAQAAVTSHRRTDFGGCPGRTTTGEAMF